MKLPTAFPAFLNPSGRVRRALIASCLLATAAAVAAGPVVSKGSGVEVDAQVHHPAGDAGSARVVLRLRGVHDPRGASLRYTVAGPARIVREDRIPLPPGTESVREISVALEASPPAPAYLNVFTTQAGRGGVVSIPLRPATAGAQPQSKAGGGPESTPGPGSLVVLPAQLR